MIQNRSAGWKRLFLFLNKEREMYQKHNLLENKYCAQSAQKSKQNTQKKYDIKNKIVNKN